MEQLRPRTASRVARVWGFDAHADRQAIAKRGRWRWADSTVEIEPPCEIAGWSGTHGYQRRAVIASGKGAQKEES
jgi:hypothetical protein